MNSYINKVMFFKGDLFINISMVLSIFTFFGCLLGIYLYINTFELSNYTKSIFALIFFCCSLILIFGSWLLFMSFVDTCKAHFYNVSEIIENGKKLIVHHYPISEIRKVFYNGQLHCETSPAVMSLDPFAVPAEDKWFFHGKEVNEEDMPDLISKMKIEQCAINF